MNANPIPLTHQVSEACRRLAVGKTALYALIKSGEIRSIKVGGRTLIPESELQGFVERRLAVRESA